MPEASRTVVIGRTPGEVFAFVSNPENDRRWRNGVLEMSHTGGAGAGARYHQVISGPGGRKVDADIELTDVQPDRLVAFRTTTGPVRPLGRYELAPEGQGTRLTLSLNAELSGIKKLVMSGMVHKTMLKEVDALEKLKTVLEGEATPAV